MSSVRDGDRKAQAVTSWGHTDTAVPPLQGSRKVMFLEWLCELQALVWCLFENKSKTSQRAMGYF